EIAVSGDGQWIALYGLHESLQLFRGDGSAVPLKAELYSVQTVAFDDAGKRLAAALGNTRFAELRLRAAPGGARAGWTVANPGLVAYAGPTLFGTSLHKQVLALLQGFAPVTPASL